MNMSIDVGEMEPIFPLVEVRSHVVTMEIHVKFLQKATTRATISLSRSIPWELLKGLHVTRELFAYLCLFLL